MSWIALATYRAEAGERPGVVLDGDVFDLVQTARAAGAKVPAAWERGGVGSMICYWSTASRWLRKLEEGARRAVASRTLQPVLDGSHALAAPFVPERIFCAASNFVEHADEMGTVLATKSESKPYISLKFRNTVLAPNGSILMPPETSQLADDRHARDARCHRHRRSDRRRHGQRNLSQGA